MTTVYVIGSLRHPRVTEVGNILRSEGYDAFDDWHAGGPTADDEWQRYETSRGRTYPEALKGYAAQHTFQYDLQHITRADVGVLVLPAGKSAHLELGYMIGQGKPGYVLFDEQPERWDVMYAFCTRVCFTPGELLEELAVHQATRTGVQRARLAPWSSDR